MKPNLERMMLDALASADMDAEERAMVERQLKRLQANRGTMKDGCALCRKKENLVLTECCERWMCGESKRGRSCCEKHVRYTLCAFHHNEGHEGGWKECKKCRESFETEIYVAFGTGNHNWEVLENPPRFEPTYCDGCGKVIKLGRDGYMVDGKKYFCDDCADERMAEG